MLGGWQDIAAVVVAGSTILGFIIKFIYATLKKTLVFQEEFDEYKKDALEKSKESEKKILEAVHKSSDDFSVTLQKTVEAFSGYLDKKANAKELVTLQETVKLQSDQVNKLLSIWEKQDYKIQLLSGLKTELTATIKDIKLELGDKMEDLKEEVKSSLEETRDKYDVISHENSELKVCFEGIRKEVEYLKREH